MNDNTTIGTDRLLDFYTSIKLRDLALIQIRGQAVAEALRVLVSPRGNRTFLEQRAALTRGREALAGFDALPSVLDTPVNTMPQRGVDHE